MILVTGAAGFIGSHIVEALLDNDEKVIGVDNFDSSYSRKIKQNNLRKFRNHENFRFLELDFLKSLNKIEEFDIDEIIHLGARGGVRSSIEEAYNYTKLNILGTVKVLEFARKEDIKNFSFASSSSVYGLNTNLPFKETSRADFPTSPYAASKRASEILCYTYSHLYDISMVCLRLFSVYGPRQRPDMAIYKFTNLIDNNKTVEIFGDGKTKRDYTYISDIVSGIISASKKRFGYEIINLGSGRSVELLHIINLIERALGKKAKIRKISQKKGDLFITHADITKARQILKYKPKVEIEEGIEKFVRWYKSR